VHDDDRKIRHVHPFIGPHHLRISPTRALSRKDGTDRPVGQTQFAVAHAGQVHHDDHTAVKERDLRESQLLSSNSVSGTSASAKSTRLVATRRVPSPEPTASYWRLTPCVA
jgi:hypothetical protein